MNTYYLAVDIGASSGRHMLGHMEDGKMVLEEIYRFPNGIVERNGHKCWDLKALFEEILNGMEKCSQLGKLPVSMSIDTWAVDFVLLNKNEQMIGDSVSYRDGRTAGMDEIVYKYVDEKRLYMQTGIQKQIFNTIYQLMAIKQENPALLGEARYFLMIPDYFHYLLTGVMRNEYTNASTTQLLNPQTKEWDRNLIAELGFAKEIFQEISLPGTILGTLREEIRRRVGYDLKVILPASHDTASAVMAVPALTEDCLYISSGTWSLLGTELAEANTSEQSHACNFTNEGGYEYRFRFLKNIMGMWMIQSVKREMAPDKGFGEICSLAAKSNISSLVDCNAQRFLAPANMTEEVKNACRESGQQIPQTIGEVAAVIYNSLAKCYANAIEELEQITGRTYPRLYIVGGGCNASYLNELTAKNSRRKVLAGPSEATAIGNIMAQLIAQGELENLPGARKCVADSFPVQIYEP